MAKKKNILLYFPYNTSMSGGPNHLLSLLDTLDRSKYHPHVVSQIESPLIDALEKRNIDYSILELPPVLAQTGGKALKYNFFNKLKSLSAIISYNRRIKKLIRDQSIDLVWGRNIKSVLFAGWASRRTGKPMIWDIGMEKKPGLLLSIVYFIGVLLVKVVVTQADLQHEQIFGKATHAICKKKLLTIPPPIDNERVRSIEEAKINHAPDPSKFTLLTTGTVGPRKNQGMIIRAMKQLREKYPQIELYIVGPTSDEEYLEEQVVYIRENDLVKNIHFTGWSDSIPEFLAKTDVFVICSTNEGLPRAIREAMFASLPVIGTRAGGIPEGIIEERTGYVVELDDITTLVDRISILIGNPEKKLEMGRNGKSFAKSKFRIDSWISKYQLLFEKLIGSDE